MPRKTPKPRKAAQSPMSANAKRTNPRRQVKPAQANAPTSLHGRKRPDVRLPKFPGRLGGR